MPAPISPIAVGAMQVPPLEKLRALDSRAPLQKLERLDVMGDGAVDMQDAHALERMSRAAWRHAGRAGESVAAAAAASPAAPPAGDAPNLFSAVELGPRGGLQPGSMSKGQLTDLATQLAWAGQQARVAVATGATAPGSASNIHNIFADDGAHFAASSAATDVVRAIGELDVEQLRSHGVKPVATFDLDGTSMKGDIFLPMVKLMAQKKMFGDEGNAAFRDQLQKRDVDQDVVARNDGNANALMLLGMVEHAEKATDPRKTISIPDMFYASAAAMKGQKVEKLQAAARDLMVHGPAGGTPYRDNVNDTSGASGDGVRDVVAALKKRGVEPWVVSHGFDWLAEVAAPYMGVDSRNVFGTHAVAKDGVLTGELVFEPNKAKSIMRTVKSPPMLAFGDSGSDLSMMDIATVRGVVVNPTQRMRDINEQRGNDLSTVKYPATEGQTSAAPRTG